MLVELVQILPDSSDSSLAPSTCNDMSLSAQFMALVEVNLVSGHCRIVIIKAYYQNEADCHDIQ